MKKLQSRPSSHVNIRLRVLGSFTRFHFLLEMAKPIRVLYLAIFLLLDANGYVWEREREKTKFQPTKRGSVEPLFKIHSVCVLGQDRVNARKWQVDSWTTLIRYIFWFPKQNGMHAIPRRKQTMHALTCQSRSKTCNMTFPKKKMRLDLINQCFLPQPTNELRLNQIYTKDLDSTNVASQLDQIAI